MPLKEGDCRSAKPGSKHRKLSDAGGLYLWVSTSGRKAWRLAYRYGGAQHVLNIGDYPDKSLADARLARELAKQALRRGENPALLNVRSAILAPTPADAFGRFADLYIERQLKKGRAESTLKKTKWVLGYKDDPGDPDYVEGLCKKLRPLAIASIKTPDLVAELDAVQGRGHLETARRMKNLLESTFHLAIQRGALPSEADPTRALKGAVDTPQARNRAAVIQPREFGRLLMVIDGYTGHPTIKIALQLLALTFPRPGELRLARWNEVSFKERVWSIPASRTKMRKPHHIPLAPQALELFEQLRDITGEGELCFPSIRSRGKPLSDGALNAALRAMGVDGDTHVAHGFRASASSLLNERSPFRSDVIERALAHGKADKVEATYNRAEHWNERVKLAAWWADYCDKQKRGARVWAAVHS
jgi:integrase